MTTIVERYGCVLRIYDNGGATCDRYTIVPPRWAHGYRDRQYWEAIASSREPFHPQGFGQGCLVVPGPHLGRRIHWDNLPRDVRKFARDTFPQYCPPEVTP